MNSQKNPTLVFLIFKYAVLSLYVIIPIIAFMLGMQYQEYMYRKTLIPAIQRSPTPSIAINQPTPSEEKITIQGVVELYQTPPEFIADAPNTLHVLDKNNKLFDILIPSGESACPFVAERNNVLTKLKKGDSVEIYGRAESNDQIRICFADEYIRILTN